MNAPPRNIPAQRTPTRNATARLAPRILLAFSALCLAAGGGVHAQAYPKAAAVADHSTLPAFFAACFKGLWLCDSINSIAFALVFGALSLYPGVASGSLVMLLACAPIGVAVAVFATVGNFPPVYVMLAAGAAAFIAGATSPGATDGNVGGRAAP